MVLKKVILNTLIRFKDANLDSEVARERIASEIVRKYFKDFEAEINKLNNKIEKDKSKCKHRVNV